MNDGIRAKISGRIKMATDEGAIQDIFCGDLDGFMLRIS
jgi:hypothetical protein